MEQKYSVMWSELDFACSMSSLLFYLHFSSEAFSLYAQHGTISLFEKTFLFPV